jgi:hypothetical protein
MASEASKALPVPAVLSPAEGALLATQAPARSSSQLHKQIRFSIAISAARCLLTYVVLPILSPLIQPAVGHSPRIAIPLSVVALLFDARAIRSVWLSDHRWRLQVIAGYGLLIVGIAGLLGHDIWHLTQ